MKDFNYAYENLKKDAASLKSTHFQLSGSVELGESSESSSAGIIKTLYTRYCNDWQNFQKSLVSDASVHGYNIDIVLGNFPAPELPEATVTIGETGDWTSFDG